ncbi:NUDIX domain-containing protein [Streptomyces sp. NPDC048301]|uniref:NUDIX domain-containing protein n=1 Tax=unclassified Streptomyces TaxID=2593676 RepID=UPI003442699D
MKDSHCGDCGARYATETWPRTCTACRRTAYRNPLPVAVALQPVTGPDGTGLVVITRTIPPHQGGLALPGGYIDHTEDWRHAVVRELFEETGIPADENDVRPADVLSAPDGHVLLFGLLPPRPERGLPPSRPTDETSGFDVLRAPRALAFPLHSRAVHAWFAGVYR